MKQAVPAKLDSPKSSMASRISAVCWLASGIWLGIPTLAAGQSMPQIPAQPAPSPCLTQSSVPATDQEPMTAKIERAGYDSVLSLYQGCDGLWRARAKKNGVYFSLLVTPTGQVLNLGY